MSDIFDEFVGAVTYVYKEFHKDENGRAHREGEPAVVWSNGDWLWLHHGIKHRTDGPAAYYAKGPRFVYWINDEMITLDEFSRLYFITHFVEYDPKAKEVP